MGIGRSSLALLEPVLGYSSLWKYTITYLQNYPAVESNNFWALEGLLMSAVSVGTHKELMCFFYNSGLAVQPWGWTSIGYCYDSRSHHDGAAR